MSRPRDNQRSKVWNNFLPDVSRLLGERDVQLSYQDCDTWLADTLPRYGIQTRAYVSHRRRNATYRNRCIYASDSSRFLAVFPLMMAWAVNDLAAMNVAWHGPEVMRIYCELVSKRTGVPMNELKALASKHRVKVASSAWSPGGDRKVKRLAKLKAERAELQKSLDNAEREFRAFIAPVKSRRDEIDKEIRQLNEDLRPKK